MLILLKTMIVIFTFEMCFIWSLCVSSAVAPFNYAHLSPNQMHQFIKAKNSKKTLHSRKEKGWVPFWRTRIPCSFCKTIYFATGPICLQHHLFVESYTNYYCSFCTLIHIKHVFIFFYSCYCITTHWSLFLMR